LSTGAGAYSVRNNGDFIEGAGETYAGSAAGDYAFAFGRQAQANGDSSVAFGNKTKTTGANTVAFGEETVAEAEGSVAFGRGTYASKSYGLVIGKYNEIPSDELNTRLFAIGNGGSNDSRRTVFYVTEAGDTVVKGGITVSGGDIILNHDGPNLLQLGSTADGCSGELKIHGSGADTLVCYINEEGTMLLKGDIGAEGNMAILGTGSIGESLLVKNTLAIENKRLNDESRPVTLAVDGDVVIARGGTNKLTIGSSASNDVGALDIWGVSSSAPVFQVESSGNITTKGTLTVAQKTTLSNQLEVSGATTLKNTLRTEGAASFINTVGIEKLLTLGAGATITTGAVSASSSDFTIKSLTIKNGSTTTASIATEGDLVASNTLKVKVGTAEKFSVNASGDTTMAGNLTVSGGKLNLSNAKIEIIKKGNLYYYEMDKNIKLGGAYHAQGSIYLYRPDGDTGFSNLETSKAMVKIINSSGDITTKGSLDVGGTLKTTGMATMGAINASGTVTTTGSSNTFEGNVTIGKSNAAKALQVYGTITASDTIQGKSFDATSDARLKQNIVDYHCEKSILDLPIKEFEFIDDEKHIKHIGCLAQDLQQICPEIVHENVDGYLHIEETKLVYLLLQEVKALKEEIKALKGE